MAATAPDDSIREIQLSGKQLVFVFMAATVAAVVFFLCGVMVGLGVRSERTDASTALVDDSAAPAVASAADQQAGRPTAPPTDAAAVNGVLSYHTLLEGQAPPQPKLTPPQPPTDEPPVPQEAGPAPTASAAAPPAQPRPAPLPSDRPAATTAAAAKPTPTPPPAPVDQKPREAAADPGAAPYTVQVAAVKDRAAAQAVLGRLTSKGYPAYILDPAPGAPAAMFRVRVGKYKDRRDAEQAARRLRKEEQFKPLVTR